jgi:general secretion pathway protein C
MEAMDPTWSSAVVQAPDADRGRVRRVGDAVGELEVAYIGYSRPAASPTVWFVQGEALCQAHVFDSEVKTLKKKGRKKPRQVKKTASVKKRPSRKGPPSLPKQIASKIKRVGSTEFIVDRSAVDSILAKQAVLMKSVKIRPNSRNGKVESLSVARVRPDTLLGTLGIQNGDQIKAINGFSLTSPEKALEAYSRMRTASELNLEIVRHGKPLTIRYRIR